MAEPVVISGFEKLRTLTQARIGLARAGNAVATAPMLDFQRSHAIARDAVLTALDAAALSIRLDAVRVRSQVSSRAEYLQRPDLGRRLCESDRAKLPKSLCDIVIVVGDGLSSLAVERHAAPLIEHLLPMLRGLAIAPMVVAEQARVAIADDIGEAIGAKLSLILVGERPGLSSSDSLGAYLTYDPRRGRRDESRNCVSNIRPPMGLSYEEASGRIAWLIRAALKQHATGISLKDLSAEENIPLADLR